jgi:hypothetical protein
MAKITITWRNYPNCPEATEYDKGRSMLARFLSVISTISILGLIAGFIDGINDFWVDKNWSQFFAAFAYILIGGIIAHMVYILYNFFTERNLKLILLKHSHPYLQSKELVKQIKKDAVDELRATTIVYYFVFLSALILIATWSVIVFYILRIINEGVGILELILLFAFMLATVLAIIYFKNKHKN